MTDLAGEQPSSGTFLRVARAMGSLAVVRAVLGMLRVKWAAVVLGPGGVALIAQGNQLVALGVTLGSLSIANGIVTLVSAARGAGDKRREQAVIGTAVTLVLVPSAVLVLAFVAFLPQAASLLLGDHGRAIYLLPVLLGVPFAALASGHLEGVMFGHERPDLYVKASIWATVVGTIAFVLLGWAGGTGGAFWGLFGGSFALFALFLLYARSIASPAVLFRPRFVRPVARSLLAYGAVMLVTGAATALSSLVVRAAVISELGVRQGGLYQVPVALTAAYSALLTNPLWGRLHPVVARQGSGPASVRELGEALRVVAAGAGVVGMATLAFAEPVVRLAYSAEFLSAARLLPIQLLGDVFFLTALTVGVFFLALERLKVYLVGSCAFYALSTGASLVLLRRYGVSGALIGYAAAGAALAAAWVPWWWTQAGSTAFTRTASTLGYAAGGIAAQGLLVLRHHGLVVRVVLLLAWAAPWLPAGLRHLRDRRRPGDQPERP